MLQRWRRATTERVKCAYSALDKRMHEKPMFFTLVVFGFLNLVFYFHNLSASGAAVRGADADQQLVQLSHQIAFVSGWEPSISSGSSSESKSRRESKRARSLSSIDDRFGDVSANVSSHVSFFRLIVRNKKLKARKSVLEKYVRVENVPFSSEVVKLAKFLCGNRYRLVVINYNGQSFPYNWQLVHLAVHLMSSGKRAGAKKRSVDVRFLMQAVEERPSVELIGAVRQMARHSSGLLVTSELSRRRLVHAYGVNASCVEHLEAFVTTAAATSSKSKSKMSPTTTNNDNNEIEYFKVFESDDEAAAAALARNKELLFDMLYTKFVAKGSGADDVDIDDDKWLPKSRVAWFNRRVVEPNVAAWTTSSTAASNNNNKFKKHAHKLEKGVYSLYADHNVQLNMKVDAAGLLESLAVRAHNKYVILDGVVGLEAFDYESDDDNDEQPQQQQQQQLQQQQKQLLRINFRTDSVIVNSHNVKFVLTRVLTKNKKGAHVVKLSIRFVDINRHAHAFGLLGSRLAQVSKDDRSTTTTDSNGGVDDDPDVWMVANGLNLFSHFAPGQSWSKQAHRLYANAFPLAENDLQAPGADAAVNAKLTLLIECSQLFINSGYAVVNRRLYFEMLKRDDLRVLFRHAEQRAPIGPAESEKSAEILATYAIFLRQINREHAFGKAEVSADHIYVSFRNSYPPIMSQPDVVDQTIVITHIPWEYYAFPTAWLKFFNRDSPHGPHDIWVPSVYGKQSLVANNVSDEKIFVIPHGVYYHKYQLELNKYPLATSKRFKFFANAGIVKRKGLDVLLKAYTSAFTRDDDVTLVIHSIYSFHASNDFILRTQRKRNVPEIIFMNHTLSEIDMIRLYKSVDVYVTPYRSEGFGLTIIEAMAAELPVIVTRYGPSLDFCTDDSVFFVDAEETVCDVDPCGKLTIFGKQTLIQPRWSEPNVKSLAQRMIESYKSPDLLDYKATHAKRIAANYSFAMIGDLFYRRLMYLVEKFKEEKSKTKKTSQN